ncbi:MAG: hypothetical protein OEZ01_02100 [Candidatus Heimdallarchaeota archaeon]|nr:hypothetical protein [Candidatus Heimdallarchaeota archaeon]MDH5644767.1 hypothetical protein [Candidatus Heimdallarchaeota archaeon]
MYETREFWKKTIFEYASPYNIIEQRPTYVFIHNKRTNKMSISYLNFENDQQFLDELKELKQYGLDNDCKSLGITVCNRDPYFIDKSSLEQLGVKPVTELALLGLEVSQEVLDKLNERHISNDYTLKEIEFDVVLENKEIHKLLFNHFPSQLFESIENTPRVLQNWHESTSEHSQKYFIVEYINSQTNEIQIVGLSKYIHFLKGVKKEMMYLAIAVTDKNHRGNGLYKALLAIRMKYALIEGAKFCYTDSDVSTSYPILRKMGMEEIYRQFLYVLNYKES